MGKTLPLQAEEKRKNGFILNAVSYMFQSRSTHKRKLHAVQKLENLKTKGLTSRTMKPVRRASQAGPYTRPPFSST
jgi:hypothetical protein